MRTAFPLTKDHRAAATGILLIVAILLAGVAACDGAGAVANTYQLAVSSASGGSVPTPGAGTFTYDAGMVVQLVATPDDGYQFLSWTGATQGIANPSAAATTITMNDNYAIVANFDIEGADNPGDGGSSGGDPSGGGPYD